MSTLVREFRSREVLLLGGGAAASTIVGVSIVHGGSPAVALAGVVVGLMLVLLLASLRERALIWWAVPSVIAYPFVRVPQKHTVVTFDRLWILGLLGLLLLERRAVPANAATRALTKALFVFALWYGIRAVTTNASFSSAGRFAVVGTWIDAGLLPLLVFVAASRVIVTADRARRLAGSLVIAGTILSGIGIAEKIAHFELASRSGGTRLLDTTLHVVRISGPYSGTEMFIVGLLICLAATLYWTQVKGPSAFVVGYSAATLMVVTLGLTLFRVAWLGILAVVVIAFGLRPRQFTRGMTVLLIVAFLAAAAVLVLDRNQTFTTRLSGQVAQNNITGRLVTYDQGWRIFRKSPVAGVGVSRFQVEAAQTPVYAKNGVRALGYPHNSYLGALAEQGLIGFLALLWVSLGVWRVISRLKRVAVSREDVLLVAGVTAAAVGYLLASLTLYLVTAGPANAFLALFVGAAAGRLDALSAGTERGLPSEG
jgi:hypothetical protein